MSDSREISRPPAAPPGVTVVPRFETYRWWRRIRERRSAAALVVGASLLAAALVLLLYVRRTYADVVFVDGMTNLPIVDDYFSGRLSLAKLFAPAAEHRLALYRLILIASSSLFSLNMYLDPILSGCCSIATAAILYLAFRKTMGQTLSPLATALAFVPMIAICVSLAYPPTMFMSTQFHLSTLVVLVIGIVLWHGEPSRTAGRFIVAGGLIIAYFALFSGAYFPGLLASIGAVLLFRLVLERKFAGKGEWSMFLLALACACIYLQTTLPGHGAATPAAHRLIGLFHDFGETARFFLAGLAASLVDIHSVEETFAAEFPGFVNAAVLSVGVLVLLFCLVSIWLLVRSGMWRKTYLPIWLLAYPAGIIVALRSGRADHPWMWMMSEWYSFHLKFIPLAVYWILLFAVLAARDGRAVAVRAGHPLGAAQAGPGPLRRREVIALSSFCLLLAGTWLYSNSNQWTRGPYAKSWVEARREAILFPDPPNDPPEKLLLVTHDEATAALAILRKYRLNVLREPRLAPPVGQTLAEARKGRGWYGDGWIRASAPVTLRSGPQGRIRLSVYLPEQVFREAFKNQIQIDLILGESIVASRTVTEKDFGEGKIVLEAAVPPNTESSLEIRVNKSFVPRNHPGLGQDNRELAAFVTELVGY